MAVLGLIFIKKTDFLLARPGVGSANNLGPLAEALQTDVDQLRAEAQVAAIAMTPRSAISSPTGRLSPTIFTIVSLQTKDPMAQTMRRPARSAVFCGRRSMGNG